MLLLAGAPHGRLHDDLGGNGGHVPQLLPTQPPVDAVHAVVHPLAVLSELAIQHQWQPRQALAFVVAAIAIAGTHESHAAVGQCRTKDTTLSLSLLRFTRSLLSPSLSLCLSFARFYLLWILDQSLQLGLLAVQDGAEVAVHGRPLELLRAFQALAEEHLCAGFGFGPRAGGGFEGASG